MSLIMILSINKQPDIRLNCSATTNPQLLAKERYVTTQLIGTLEIDSRWIYSWIPKWRQPELVGFQAIKWVPIVGAPKFPWPSWGNWLCVHPQWLSSNVGST